jgi:hypothetical protein
MLYLEALRRHLPQNKYPGGALTNLKRFIFYCSTGHYGFVESRPIETEEQVALYLYDLHNHARLLNSTIDAACPSRTPLDIEQPFPQDDVGGEEGDGGGEVGGGKEVASNAGPGSEPVSTPAVNKSLLTALALKRHDNALAATRRRLHLA